LKTRGTGSKPKSRPSASRMGVQRTCGRIIFSVVAMRSWPIKLFTIGFVFSAREAGRIQGPRSYQAEQGPCVRAVSHATILLELANCLYECRTCGRPVFERGTVGNSRLAGESAEAFSAAGFFGDLVRDGLCGVSLSGKLRVSQPTAVRHMRLLEQAGLVRRKGIRPWTFCKRDKARIGEIKKAMAATI
jgi:DNA-binding transcriptional ArsR family regulator